MKKFTTITPTNEDPLEKALRAVSEMDQLEPNEPDDLFDLDPEILGLVGLRFPTIH